MNLTYFEKEDAILIAICLIAICAVLLVALPGKSGKGDDLVGVAERTRPVGVVVVKSGYATNTETPNAEEPVITQSTNQNKKDIAEQPVATTVAAVSGESVVKKSCASCHQSGLMGAPAIGDNAAWQNRLAAGFDVLLQHAINGFNSMPAKGGNSTLQDAEVEQAILFMLAESNITVPGKALIDVTELVSVSETESLNEAEASNAEINTTEEQAEAVVSVAASAEGIDTVTEEADANDAEVVALNTVNKIPDTIQKTEPPPGKHFYNENCANCHNEGSESAPVMGDQQAWLPAFSKGIDSLTQEIRRGTSTHPQVEMSNAQLSDALNYIMQQTFWPDMN